MPVNKNNAPRILILPGISPNNMYAKIVEPIGSPSKVIDTREAGK